MDKSESLIKKCLLFAIVPIVLLPWLLVQFNIALNTNHAWLLEAASRLLEGKNLLTDVYESNPPLSILLYFPPVLLHQYLGIALEYTPYIYGVLGLSLSSLAIWKLLSLSPKFNFYDRSAFVSCYVIAGALLPSNIYFAERDEFVLWGLFPFLIAQALMISAVKVPPLKAWCILLPCAICILVKPHYILLPGLAFLYKLVMKRSLLDVIKGVDFLALFTAGILYGLVVVIFFMEYITEILPLFLKYYVSYADHATLQRFAYYCIFASALAILSFVLKIPKEDKKIIFFILGAGIVSILLYLIQAKGFVYHLIPARIFMFVAGGWFVYSGLKRYVLKDFSAALSTVLLLTACAYLFFPLNSNFMTHEKYKETKLVKLAQSCEGDCSFFIFTQNMETIWQVSLYSGVEHASRFPGLWWLHGMVLNEPDAHDQKQVSRYVGEDLARYKPQILAIAKDLQKEDGTTFNFIKFFDSSEIFRREIAHYKKTRVLKDNRRDYFQGSSLDYDLFLYYDIYDRID